MCQRVNTGESYIFYLGIFICCGPLVDDDRINGMDIPNQQAICSLIGYYSHQLVW